MTSTAGPVIHVVAYGESLTSIAAHYAISYFADHVCQQPAIDDDPSRPVADNPAARFAIHDPLRRLVAGAYINGRCDLDARAFGNCNPIPITHGNANADQHPGAGGDAYGHRSLAADAYQQLVDAIEPAKHPVGLSVREEIVREHVSENPPGGSRQDKPDVVCITEDIAVWRAPEEHEWGAPGGDRYRFSARPES